MDRFIESSSAFKPKLSVLEKKFASEEVLKTNRERLIKERLEQGKGIGDLDNPAQEARPLYEQLAERRRLAEEEFANKTKFSNLIHRLDADECAFIRNFEESRENTKLEQENEEKKKLEEFRENSKEYQAGSDRTDLETLGMKPAELFNVSTVKKASGGDRAPCVPAKKKPITAASDVQLKVLKNVILKRRPRAKGARSESAGEEDSDAGTTETGPNHKKPRVDV